MWKETAYLTCHCMRTIGESLKADKAVVRSVGENLPDAMWVCCVMVTETLLKAGVSFSKAESLCELLKEEPTTLTCASNLYQLILHEEVAKLRRKVQGRFP